MKGSLLFLAVCFRFTKEKPSIHAACSRLLDTLRVQHLHHKRSTSPFGIDRPAALKLLLQLPASHIAQAT